MKQNITDGSIFIAPESGMPELQSTSGTNFQSDTTSPTGTSTSASSNNLSPKDVQDLDNIVNNMKAVVSDNGNTKKK